MKKLFYLILFAAVLAGCSKENEDESIIYDENVGYLTNIGSVKYGLQGRWAILSSVIEKEYHENTVCDGRAGADLIFCADYEILKKENKFYLNTASHHSIITRLDKDTLFRQYYHMNSKDTIINGYERIVQYEHVDKIDTCWHIGNN
jgi:hypothetical protein